MQSIPHDATETTTFTPDSLKGLDQPPVFTFRTLTGREKRWMRRLVRREGVVQHSQKDIRDEILNGLKTFWSADDYEAHLPRIKEYWESGEEYALQLKDDPDLEWDFDTAEEERILKLFADISDAHPPIREMGSDNADFQEVSVLALFAVSIQSFDNLDCKIDREKQYFTLETCEGIGAALFKLAEKAGLGEDALIKPRLELIQEVNRLYRLGDEAEGNSGSPAQSGTSPKPSKSKTSSALGTSPSAEPSSETPSD